MNGENNSCVLIFVKYPMVGQVKTRLAQQTGPEIAAEVYRNFVIDLLATLHNLNAPLRIFFEPADALQKFHQWLGTEYSYFPQSGGNLGEKIKNAFLHGFADNFSKLVLIGSDIPDLPPDFVNLSLGALDTHDAVIGPSSDGGYYLIGFSKEGFLPQTFENIAWSTDSVFEDTISTLKRHKTKVYLLPQWHDVDTLEDLYSLLSRNKSTDFRQSRTFSFLRTRVTERSNV
jgi:rSAM/selenodomain-associated transferase 1